MRDIQDFRQAHISYKSYIDVVAVVTVDNSEVTRTIRRSRRRQSVLLLGKRDSGFNCVRSAYSTVVNADDVIHGTTVSSLTIKNFYVFTAITMNYSFH